MGWPLVALIPSVILVAGSVALNAYLAAGYGALAVIVPAEAMER